MVGKIIAVDLGGTYLRTAVVKNDKILKYEKIKTPKNKTDLIRELISQIEKLMTNDVKGIGVASPGPLKDGIIKNPPNLALQNCNLKKVLKDKFRVRVEIENDANCVALAEAKVGCKKKNFIVLTLGTGIGGGIIINNELYRGQGYAGEFGHMILDNGKYFEILGAWNGGKNLKKLSSYIGQGIASLINVFDPEVVVLAGGMRKGGNKFLVQIRKQTKRYCLLLKKHPIVWSKIKHPGIIGASLLIQ